jgi:hypothetical protein
MYYFCVHEACDWSGEQPEWVGTAEYQLPVCPECGKDCSQADDYDRADDEEYLR